MYWAGVFSIDRDDAGRGRRGLYDGPSAGSHHVSGDGLLDGADHVALLEVEHPPPFIRLFSRSEPTPLVSPRWYGLPWVSGNRLAIGGLCIGAGEPRDCRRCPRS